MVAIENVRSDYPDVEYADSAEGTDGAVVATDWPEFDDLSFEGMSRTVVVDGRPIDVDESALEVYEGLTWEPLVELERIFATTGLEPN